ncbi:Aspartyl/glutamyl-tRNA(Asn/Gln) amidotransferase subunit B [bioreactor metagenome]|uniref:Aspartyl/glutamyl-tRNA(Asn/Gln) amidotransferase subunit B n=1 Tax=bioreactor metagenome TaxID=1076179 RepID=A0A644T6W1_9ZZZZ|nr:Asp-tRNA(Asn)/Glu-tRNA(Gln) amidotransferase subunit GatB [Candidatus Elulimicrobiales bacterium]
MENKYYITIGLEIHAELKTNSKMFCSCANVPLEDSPNKNVCPICMAHPGTLPVLNKEAIKKMIEIGLYIKANIADFTEWDRKHYFYPDIPKAYQLTQYKYPIVSGGAINNWPLTRIHLEEDTAKSTHDQGDHTLIDFNRSGVPLMELVTEPQTFDDIEIAAKACSDFAKELQLILRTLDASEAEMSKGQMRIEVNLSVTQDKNKFGTKVEVKNINSFKSVEDSVRFEAKRHIELNEAGKKDEIVQETRGFEENKRITVSQRKKESANDYKYFPDPDLPKLYLHTLFDLKSIEESLPERLPEIRQNLKDAGVKEEYVELLLNNTILFKYFDEVKKEIENHDFSKEKINKLINLSVNYICVDVSSILQKSNTENLVHFVDEGDFVEIMEMLLENELSSRGAKDLITFMMTELSNEKMLEMAENDMSAREIAEMKGLIQKNDKESLEKILNTVIENNKEQWEALKNGNEKLIMFFVGQAMKEAKGSGNPQLFTEIIKEKSLN